MRHPVPVAPFVGAWIEIAGDPALSDALASLRSSERGLKFNVRNFYSVVVVAPFVGAWIEIYSYQWQN